jgi:hypothetical protein
MKKIFADSLFEGTMDNDNHSGKCCSETDEVVEQASIDEYIKQINLAIKRMYKVDEFTFTVEELSAVSFKLANAFKSTKEDDILSIGKDGYRL